MTTEYLESGGVKDIVGVKLLDANLQAVDSATFAEQQAQTALLDDIKSNTTNLVKSDKEVPFERFIVKQDFPGASVSDVIVTYIIVNTTDGTFVPGKAVNFMTGLEVTLPTPVQSYLTDNGGNPLTLDQLKLVMGDTVANPVNYTTAYWLKLLNQSQSFVCVTAQNLSITASSTQSSAVNASTNKIIITAMGNDAYVLLGSNPTATVGGVCIALADGVPSIPLTVTPGVTKVATIASAAGGVLNIAEYA